MDTIKFKRGLKKDLPRHLALGEPAFCTDTGELFVGMGDNLPLKAIQTAEDVTEFEKIYNELNLINTELEKLPSKFDEKAHKEHNHDSSYASRQEFDSIKDQVTQNRPIIISEDTPIGTIIWWSAKDINNNIDSEIWKVCNGQTLNKTDFLDLWNIIGNNSNYSNNGGNTFKLPNLINDQKFIKSVNTDYNVGVTQDNYIINSIGDTETKAKSIAFIPLIKCKQRAKDMSTVAQEWTDFKENGGEINGIIKLLNSYIKAKGIINDESEVAIGSRDKKIWFGELGASDGEFSFRPQGADRGAINIGWVGFEFKDIFLYGYHRSSTGYSKLPNGLILQWGVVSKSHTDGYINFPITFPTAVFHVWTDLECTSDYWGGNIYQQRVDNTRFRLVHLNKNQTAPGNPIWIAIGQ